MWQAVHVVKLLRSVRPDVEAVLVTSDTFGDLRQDLPIREIGGKGVFSKEIQEVVLAGQADLAVHSAKDLQAVTPDGLIIAAFCHRDDPRDALVGSTLDDLPKGATVATGSNRRRALLHERRPDLRIVGLRGNIATRLAKLDAPAGEAGPVDAVVLAVAALDRLGVTGDLAAPMERLDPEWFVPQVGQAVVAVEARQDDEAILDLVKAIDHPETSLAVTAERSFLAELGGDCSLPAGAHAVVEGAASAVATGRPAVSGAQEISIRGVLAADDGTLVQRAVETGPASDDPGRELARTLRKMVEAAEPADG